ncbi:uncharacterized protein Triagg1_444 [Trichoderma aggressivum f. europaeum]|uniref:Uncharacterized protein n=1 Tax=Trichoderma aggressivum f. europaeum TaxID=173218 RepID=A0AAE1IND3_9HYPO|nr:hypothetical protein Triagg1_444 [Trichoderma aggressivum f. europaeum]
MKVSISIFTIAAVMASTAYGCFSCHDCPGDQVCFFAATHGTGGIGGCVEPTDSICFAGEGFCDTDTCE